MVGGHGQQRGTGCLFGGTPAPAAAPAASRTTPPAAPARRQRPRRPLPLSRPLHPPRHRQLPPRLPSRAAPLAGWYGGSLVYGLNCDFDDTLDPQVTNFDTTIRVTLNMCEPLVWEPEPGKFVPGLADSWEISPDAKTYTFKLKKGVKFHDGTPFNADAVKFTFDRVVDPATKAGQSHDQLGPYDHTEIVDDHTVKVVMKQPYAPLLTNLNGYLGIVSPTAVQKKGMAAFARQPVGTGPSCSRSGCRKDHVTLVKNPDYNWGSSYLQAHWAGLTGPGHLQDHSRAVGAHGHAQDAARRSIIDEIDPLEYDALSKDPNFVMIMKGQPGSGWILLLNTTSKGADQRSAVRLAMEYAIDREGLNKSVFQGLEQGRPGVR